MINPSELRIGNLGSYKGEMVRIDWPHPCEIVATFCDDKTKSECIHFDLQDIDPIPLTPEALEKCGFKQLPHFTVQNNWFINIGRDRVISIACVGTPNEMVFVNEEEPPVVKNLIVVRNYDYDGKTYLHHIQNIYHQFTNGKELQYQP